MDNLDDSYIICKYEIFNENLKQPTQIINSLSKIIDKEIKDSFDFYLDDKKIDFTLKYKFPKEGIYTLKIICKKNIENISYLFYECMDLIYLDLSHFETSKVTSMSHLLNFCSSLTELNLSNFIIFRKFRFIKYIYR